MTTATLTTDAKNALSRTIRRLRSQLLTDLRNHTDSLYQMAAPVAHASLSAAALMKRRRLEAWLDEQVRGAMPDGKGDAKALRERFRLQAEKLVGATILNRLVVIKCLEATGIQPIPIVTGGWESAGYKEFRDYAAPLLSDESEGYATLLQLLYDELATDMPGLFGDTGLTALLPLPVATLRSLIAALDQPELQSAWTDDTTLGWVYQYWNDPEREALDDKINAGGKVESHEIASKTQMFTERYMVEWLLQNSLGPIWLAMCEKNGWTPDLVSTGTDKALEERRIAWRAKRETGEVALDALMPIHGELEGHWKYRIPQALPADASDYAPETLKTLKLLDPACGSGHFLVIAFDLLFALYQEEARHRGETWTDKAIVESILENNLYGIDIDLRAVQIAAAALMLKAKQRCAAAQPKRLHLVASNLQLAGLPKNDQGLVELRDAIRHETGIGDEITDQVVKALHGADHLGSLLQIDKAVDQAIRQYEQGLLTVRDTKSIAIPFADEAKRSILAELEGFLAKHTGSQDLGLRLRTEQLAAGVRFIRMVQPGTYDPVYSPRPVLPACG